MLPDNHFYSTLLGYISLATCVAIGLPQAFLHWRQKSARGISLTMLWLWLIGDLASLVGTVVQGLLHTLIILGVINGLIDVLLIWQCYHYAKWQQFAPLVSLFRGRPRSSSNITEPSSASPNDTLANLSPPAPYKRSKWNTPLHILYIILVVGISIMVWGVVVARVRKTANLHPGEDGTDPDFSPVGAAFGWISMFIYTTSRYPQIYKNWKAGSCQNLSIYIFALLVIYNSTNISSILVKSRSRSYLIVNLPWIVNSSFNIILDMVIMGQFVWYRKVRTSPAEAELTPPAPRSIEEEVKEPV